jgi:hypothetical protein
VSLGDITGRHSFPASTDRSSRYRLSTFTASSDRSAHSTLATLLHNYLAHLRDLTYGLSIPEDVRDSEEVSEKRRALVGSRGLHEKTEIRGELIGGGRNKTQTRPELGCRFYLEIRSSDWSAPKKQGDF